MIDLLPNDVIADIIKFLNIRDTLNLRLCSTWFSKVIQDDSKIDDEQLDITWNSHMLMKLHRCVSCGRIFPSENIMLKHHSDVHSMNEHLQLTYKYSLSEWQLISKNDIECAYGKCNCQSKNFLGTEYVRYLTPVEGLRRKIRWLYNLYTDYGIVFMDTGIYAKRAGVFSDCVLYKSSHWKSKEDIKCPRVLQTRDHHWLILGYSSKIVPIKTIVRWYPK